MAKRDPVYRKQQERQAESDSRYFAKQGGLPSAERKRAEGMNGYLYRQFGKDGEREPQHAAGRVRPFTPGPIPDITKEPRKRDLTHEALMRDTSGDRAPSFAQMEKDMAASRARKKATLSAGRSLSGRSR